MAYFIYGLGYKLTQDAATEQAQEADQADATRLSILKHIHTPCQEEVEKMVLAGVALWNKLLRTDVDSFAPINSNITFTLISTQCHYFTRWSTDSCRKCRTK